MMHMTFYWGKRVTLLFDDWKTNTWAGYGLTLLVVFLFAVFHGYIVNLRSRFKGASTGKVATDLSRPFLRGHRREFASRAGESALFGLSTGLGYLLMLAVMSFNGGVFIAAILGLVVGYLVFRNGSVEKENIENPGAL